MLSIIRLEKEMYKSGQRMTLDFDTTPLSFDLKAPLSSDLSSEDYDENIEEDSNEQPLSSSKYDYNYLME